MCIKLSLRVCFLFSLPFHWSLYIYWAAIFHSIFVSIPSINAKLSIMHCFNFTLISHRWQNSFLSHINVFIINERKHLWKASVSVLEKFSRLSLDSIPTTSDTFDSLGVLGSGKKFEISMRKFRSGNEVFSI